jgi:hypothetical protein
MGNVNVSSPAFAAIPVPLQVLARLSNTACRLGTDGSQRRGISDHKVKSCSAKPTPRHCVTTLIANNRTWEGLELTNSPPQKQNAHVSVSRVVAAFVQSLLRDPANLQHHDRQPMS